MGHSTAGGSAKGNNRKPNRVPSSRDADGTGGGQRWGYRLGLLHIPGSTNVCWSHWELHQ